MNLSTLGACPTFFKNMNLSHTPAQELEDRYTQVPLLPSDPKQRQAALEIVEDLESSHDVGAAGFKFMAGGERVYACDNNII
jgi:hypothetical protein